MAERRRPSANEGFYCNWEVIVRAYVQKRFAALCTQEGVVGFLIWYQKGKTAELCIAEIHPMHRKKGLWRNMLQHFESYLLSQIIVWISLQCKPVESEATWQKMQFTRMPGANWEDGVKMYKIIVAHQLTKKYEKGFA